MNTAKTKLQIMQTMQAALNNDQLKRLGKVLDYYLLEDDTAGNMCAHAANDQILDRFITAKKLEGCSERSMAYYSTTLNRLFTCCSKNVCEMDTDDIREYLVQYKSKGTVSQVTVDNVRRVISSFFSWLEDENYILKSPARRIKKVKSIQAVREVLSDEDIERLRDNCRCIRDLAIIDILRSTGMRVGELVRLDKDSIDFVNQECTVLGKGNKERTVYFDSRTKLHLEEYLATRSDANNALFVSLHAPFERLQISGVESLLRKLGRKLNLGKVHPHKFRRTLATKAIDKGMPIEQVQVLLGHKKIDTTMHYAMVNQQNVKNSHRRYIS